MSNFVAVNRKKRPEFFTIFCALLKNKLRFDAKITKSKKILLFCVLAFAYIVVEIYAVLATVQIGAVMAANGGLVSFYVLLMAIGGAVVLVFGIFNFVSTLFLSKDGEFFSALPVKSQSVFIAKILYVYLSDAAVVIAVLFPVIIALGVVAKAGALFFVISLLTLPLMPALPLCLASIVALPVMYLAAVVKHRNVVLFVFYCVLFLGIVGLYAYFIVYTNTMSDMEFGNEQAASMLQPLAVVERVLYPYAALSRAAFGVGVYGLNVPSSVFVNLLIFLLCNALLVLIIIMLGKIMYDRSYKINGQTDNSQKKVVKHHTSGMTWALIKREYTMAMRTPSVAFQCFVVFGLPILFGTIFSFTMPSMFAGSDTEVIIDPIFFLPLIMSVAIITVSATINAAITSFSREGISLGFLKMLPIDGKQIVKAKMLAWAIPCAISSIVTAVVINAINFDTVNFMLSLLAFIWMPFVYVVFGVLWDLRSPKLTWNDPMQAIKHNVNATIGQFICMIPGFVLSIVSGFILAIQMPLHMIYGVYWSIAYVLLLAFAVVDIVLYRKADKYYNRVEF